MADFYVYENGVRVGLVESLISVQWLMCYRKAGEVKLVARATEANLELLKEDNRIWNSEAAEAAIVEAVEITDNMVDRIMTVRCSASSSLLDQRVVMATEEVLNVEQSLYSIYTKNRRELSIGVAAAKGYVDELEVEATWGTVLDAALALCAGSTLGFRTVFTPETAAETFEVYQGTNRTSGEDFNGWFGDDIGNLANLSITEDKSTEKNVAVVAGEIDDTNPRVVVTVSIGNVQGDTRREMYVDARSVRKKYDKAVNTGQKDAKGNPIYTYTKATYSDAKYKKILEGKGTEALLKTVTTLDVDCEVTDNPLRFGTDYFLGDVLPVKLTAYGLAFNARVLEARMVYEESGRKTVVKLGDFELEETT